MGRKGKVNTYNFLITVQTITGLPDNWTGITLQHPASRDPLNLTVHNGVAACNYTLDFRRTYTGANDKKADAKFRLLGDRSKKVAKLHVNLEELRQMLVQKDEVITIVRSMDNSLALNIEITFTFDYFGEDGNLSERSMLSDASSEGDRYDDRLVVVTVPPGPLGASFANSLIPPTVLRLVDTPGGQSPLLGKVVARSELVRFNNMDTTSWGLAQFKSQLVATKKDAVRELVFRLPLPSSTPRGPVMFAQGAEPVPERDEHEDPPPNEDDLPPIPPPKARIDIPVEDLQQDEEEKRAAEAHNNEPSIHISRYVRAKDDRYILYVVTSRGVANNRNKVSVLRRYNNFVALKQQLELEADGILPPLPDKYSFTAVFNRFSEPFVQERRRGLEDWLNDVYDVDVCRTDTLISFLTKEPDMDVVLDFSSKEALHVVTKKSGDVRLYAENDVQTPRTPWIPSDSELREQLDTFSLYGGVPQADKPSQEAHPAPKQAGEQPRDEEERPNGNANANGVEKMYSVPLTPAQKSEPLDDAVTQRLQDGENPFAGAE